MWWHRWDIGDPLGEHAYIVTAMIDFTISPHFGGAKSAVVPAAAPFPGLPLPRL
jgi:hypothetical protein